MNRLSPIKRVLPRRFLKILQTKVIWLAPVETTEHAVDFRNTPFSRAKFSANSL